MYGSQHRLFSPQSLTCADVMPEQRSLSSLSAGWQSVYLEVIESPSSVEPYDVRTTPDHRITLLTKGHVNLERLLGRSWEKAVHRPGTATMVAGLNGGRIRLSPLSTSVLESVRIYIPQVFFREAVEELRKVSDKRHTEMTNLLFYGDPLLYQVAKSMVRAISFGAPELYAESATNFLATHLLSFQSSWRGLNEDARREEAITDRRLARVLAYMEDNFKKPLSVAELAREAGSSRFHFVKLFREKVGLTPHRHLVQLRMTAAASMLTTTDLTIAQVASACGMQNAAHFAAAFARHFSRTPSAFRQSYRSSLDNPTRGRRRS